MSRHLTRTEREELEELCEIVTANLDSYLKAGWALMKIRDKRLWEETHDTFEEFCRDRWKMSDSRARQLIGAAHVAANVMTVTIGNGHHAPPPNERQARVLAPLPAEQQREIWEAATDDGERETTAEELAELRRAATAIASRIEDLPPEEQAAAVKRQEGAIRRKAKEMRDQDHVEKGTTKLRAAKKEFAAVDGAAAVKVVRAIDKVIELAEAL